jgi:hypothetical protein
LPVNLLVSLLCSFSRVYSFQKPISLNESLFLLYKRNLCALLINFAQNAFLCITYRNATLCVSYGILKNCVSMYLLWDFENVRFYKVYIETQLNVFLMVFSKCAFLTLYLRM